MPMPIAPILGILADNLRKRGSVLPLSKRVATGWARGLDLPRGGETVLYTGHMYQMIPALEVMSSQMAVLENSFMTRFMGMGRLLNKFVNLSFFMCLTASSEKMQHSNQVLRDIAGLLHDAGVEFGYLYEEELYAGALVHDEGMDEAFGNHARRVAEHLKEARRPAPDHRGPSHHQYVASGVPALCQRLRYRGQSYLEVLAQAHPAATEPVNGEVVVHDSCVYARDENVVDQPRELLRAAGLAVRDPELSGKSTHCCGGPLESLFPAEAHRISGIRVDQLEAEGKNVVTMCPICWVNLSKAAGDRLVINDIASTLAACRRQVAPNG